MKTLIDRIRRKTLLLLASLLTFYDSLLAQSFNAAAAINEATNLIKGLYDPTKRLMWVAAAISGLIGALKVYSKVMGKDPESSKHMSAYVYAALGLLVLEMFLRKLFIE